MPFFVLVSMATRIKPRGRSGALARLLLAGMAPPPCASRPPSWDETQPPPIHPLTRSKERGATNGWARPISVDGPISHPLTHPAHINFFFFTHPDGWAWGSTGGGWARANERKKDRVRVSVRLLQKKKKSAGSTPNYHSPPDQNRQPKKKKEGLWRQKFFVRPRRRQKRGGVKSTSLQTFFFLASPSRGGDETRTRQKGWRMAHEKESSSALADR